MRPLFFLLTNNAVPLALQTMLLVGVESISLLPSGRYQVQHHHQRLRRPQRQRQRLRRRPVLRQQQLQPLRSRPVLHQQLLPLLRLDQHPPHGRTQHRGRVRPHCLGHKAVIRLLIARETPCELSAQTVCVCRFLGNARVSRVGDGVLAIEDF